MPPQDWVIHQLCDSAFPAGGFAHSGGLEAAFQRRQIVDSASFEQWTRWQIHQAAHHSAPLANAAYIEPDRWIDLDALADAMLSNHVANRASRAQGGAWILAVSRIFLVDSLGEIAHEIRSRNLPGHWPVLFGVGCRRLELPQPTMVRSFLFISLRGIISAAIRLGVVGPLDGQRIQARLAWFAEGLLPGALARQPPAAAQTAPILDLIQATHDRLYSRLFQS